MNKIVKKIFAAASLLVMSTSAIACGSIGGGGDYVGELEPGFWANLAATTGGSTGSGGLGGDSSTDFVVNGSQTAAVAYDGSAVTINFYHTMGEKLREVLNPWIAEFNKVYPNITIVHESKGGYDELRELITTEMQGGSAPHIAYCYPDHVAMYKKAGAVATLDDYISSTANVPIKVYNDETKQYDIDGVTQMGFTQAELNEFVRGYLEEGRAFGDGKMYTLPYSKSTEVLYYNKTFFEKNGLQVPTTWDEMETVLQQIKAIDPNCVPLGYDSESNWFITMCEQLGTPYTSAKKGEFFLFNVEENRTFIERLRKWYQLRLVTTEELYGSYTSDLFTQTDPNELKSYMCIGSSAGASYQCPDVYVNEDNQKVYPFEVGVAMPPQISEEFPKVISQGPSLCMFKKQNKQEMAATWLFMKFLTTSMGLQANFSTESGYAPVIKNLDAKYPKYAAKLAAADGNANLAASCIKQCLSQENAMFVSPAFVGSSGARDQVGILLQTCIAKTLEDGQTASDLIKTQFEQSVNKLHSEYELN